MGGGVLSAYIPGLLHHKRARVMVGAMLLQVLLIMWQRLKLTFLMTLSELAQNFILHLLDPQGPESDQIEKCIFLVSLPLFFII